MNNLATFFRNLAIKKKILGTIFATCTVVLFVACVAFIANEALTVKNTLERDLATQAEVIARNSSAAVTFDDAVAAEETIRSLEYKPNIIDAYILASGNRVLASFHSQDKAATTAKVAVGSVLSEQSLTGLLNQYEGSRRAIIVDGEAIGSVVLLSDLSPLYNRLNSYGLTAALVMLLALSLAYLFSSRLAGRISQPILQLANTMTKVSVEKNYALRAPLTSGDEVGTLIEQFNNMLGTIEERDELLRKRGEQLKQLAHFDVLTGLPNRLLIIDRLGQAIAHAADNNEKIAVLFIDLDHFKDVNDTLGHRLGDQLLKEVATRLRSSIRGADNVGRLGGDEFVIFIAESKVIENLVIMIQRMVDSFAEPFVLEGTEIFVTASIGATIYPLDAETVDDLLKNADTAMYAVKGKGKNHYQFFSHDMQLRTSHRLELHNGLRRALERDEFFLVYQPTVDLATGVVCGFEALLRWNCPEKGIIPPLDFIPLAEETGMILPIGEWVLYEVCRQLHRWRDQGLQPLRVALNVSPVQLKKKNLAEKILTILEETGTDPNLLAIELTESSLITANEELLSGLWALKHKGIRILIDDFGTGYSSLGYLKRIPLDALKVDRSFISNSLQNRQDEVITRAILGLGKNLSLRVVGEGVETEEQLNFLRQYGCHEVQGYLFSRPILPEECYQMLTEAADGQCAALAGQ